MMFIYMSAMPNNNDDVHMSAMCLAADFVTRQPSCSNGYFGYSQERLYSICTTGHSRAHNLSQRLVLLRPARGPQRLIWDKHCANTNQFGPD